MSGSIGYETLRTFGAIEIRKYPPIVLAMVRTAYDDAAFSTLFDYISGNNRTGGKIPMTAPVISTSPGQRIEMTAPVISDAGTFSFVLPEGTNLNTAPVPGDPRIELVQVPPRHVATIRFSGRAFMRDVMEKEKELLGWLKERSIRTKGAPFLMRYNSPFAPGFLRRNEVGVEIFEEDVPGGNRR